MKKLSRILPDSARFLTGRNLFAAFSAALAALACSVSTAGAFTYKESDMLLGIRQPGGSYELVVNLGPAGRFSQLAVTSPGSVLEITNLTHDTLFTAFSDLGGLNLSMFASVVTVGQVDPPYASCWVTRARTDASLKTESWVRKLAFSQSSAATTINSVGTGATLVPGGGGNDNEAVIDAGAAFGYAARVGSLGDFGGRWQGIVEAATPSDFGSSQSSVRLDLYFVAPDKTGKRLPGDYLGFFEFSSAGTLRFTAAGPAPALASLSPSEGSASGGTLVTLTGSGFRDGVVVSFDGIASPKVTVTSPTTLTATAPAHAAGSVDVAVLSADGQRVVLAQAFTYQESSVPQQVEIAGSSFAGGVMTLLSVGATNGVTWVVASDTLSRPTSQWTPVATNRVGADGLATNLIPVDANSVGVFFRLVIP